mmetsp:Transcript_43137/g.91782  ORF Transcript_43137/g.91782 Transcript_43137/m.91782 type:complete len:202 (-) Transcript_43137:774-1379(-)
MGRRDRPRDGLGGWGNRRLRGADGRHGGRRSECPTSACSDGPERRRSGGRDARLLPNAIVRHHHQLADVPRLPRRVRRIRPRHGRRRRRLGHRRAGGLPDTDGGEHRVVHPRPDIEARREPLSLHVGLYRGRPPREAGRVGRARSRERRVALGPVHRLHAVEPHHLQWTPIGRSPPHLAVRGDRRCAQLLPGLPAEGVRCL